MTKIRKIKFFNEIVWVIETFGFNICFGFGASDFEFSKCEGISRFDSLGRNDLQSPD